MDPLGFIRQKDLGVLLLGSLDFNFWGFYMTYNKEARSLAFRRGSEVSQV